MVFPMMINPIQYNIQNYTRYSQYDPSVRDLLSQPSLSTPSKFMDRFSLAHFSAPKMGEAWTKSDVLKQLWVEAHAIDLNDPDASAGPRLGPIGLNPTEEDFAELARQMEAQGLSGEVDFSRVASDFSNRFSSVHAGDLGDAIDYLASIAVTLGEQINRNYSGEALEQKRQELAKVIQHGQAELIDSYTSRLQSALGLSESDTQTIRATMESLISQRTQEYQAVQAEMPNTLTGTQDEWLLNQYQYMASQLREAVGPVSDSASGGELTLYDLRVAGEIGGAYQELYKSVSEGSGGNEACLAMDLAMTDMKMETLIQKGLVSGKMAEMLQGSLEQRHQTVMDISDRCLAVRRENAHSEGLIPDLDRQLLQSIYDVVLGSFRQNGGDALEAIRDGVTFGKSATAQAGRQNPKVSRWGVSMDHYWAMFYTSSEVSDLYGGTRTQKSAYETYADSWQHFLSSLSSQKELFMAFSGNDVPSYGPPYFVDATV